MSTNLTPRGLRMARISREPGHSAIMNQAIQYGLNLLNRPEDPSDVRYGCIGCRIDSTASPPDCSSKCPACSAQYRPLAMQQGALKREYATAYSDDVAQNIIRAHVDTTNGNLEYVKVQLEQHADTVVKRWSKRNPQKRSELLRTAMPEMHAHKWLQDQLFLDEPAEDEQANAEGTSAVGSRRKAWLLPYLTIEALSEDPVRLLAVLYYRTAYTPSDWLMFDVERTKLAFEDARAEVAYNPHCVIACEEAGEYGALVPWTPDKAHRCDIIGFPRAQLAFEAQHELSDFLRRSVDLLLASGPIDKPQGRIKWETLVSDGFTSSDIGHSSYVQRAFSAPEDFSAQRIADFLNSRLQAAEDELWLLQSDPVYFREMLATVEKTAHYRGLSGDGRLNHLLQRILGAVGKVELLQAVNQEASGALITLKNHGSRPRRGEAMPEPYEEALGVIHGTLESLFKLYKADLVGLTTETSTFQQYLTRNDQGTLALNAEAELVWRKDPLFWNFSQLCFPYEIELFSLDRGYHLGYIADLLSLPKEKRRVDQVLYDHFSDMLATDEALSAVRSHVPRTLNLGQDAHEALVPLATTFRVTSGKCNALRALLGDLLRAPVPSNKVHGDTLRRMKTLHDRTTGFWAEFCTRRSESAVEDGRTVEECARYTKNLSAYCDVGQLAEFTRECEKLEERLETKEPAAQARSSSWAVEGAQPPTVQTVWDEEPNAVGTHAQPKLKIKTRPTNPNSIGTELDRLQVENDAPRPEQDRLAVSGDSIRVFDRMFSAYSEAKGPVKWEQLVSALTDAGLSVTQRGGSAVTFLHESRGSIVVHRPHPDPNVDSIRLRSMGKRLRKWFGWDEGTFIER